MLSTTNPTLAFHSPFAMDVVLAALRSGEWPLLDYLDELEAHFEEREPEIEAFVPENGRFDRLRDEAEALLGKYPDPGKRPLLFGLPIGVKDIFHVDGFVPSNLLAAGRANINTYAAARTVIRSNLNRHPIPRKIYPAGFKCFEDRRRTMQR